MRAFYVATLPLIVFVLAIAIATANMSALGR